MRNNIKKQFDREIAEKAIAYLNAFLASDTTREHIFYDQIYEIAHLAKRISDEEAEEDLKDKDESEE